MDNGKNDLYFIARIVNDMSFIVEHTKDATEEDLKVNELLLDSMMFRLIQISENAKRLSEEYKAEHDTIPWTSIYGLRNRIVHDYGNVDLGIIFDTLTKDIPELLEVFSNNT